MTRERSWYRWYVLLVLILIYAFSFIDRQIVTILAPYIKADLGISDAQLGLLYGTSFALFYSVFGIPLARLADGWSRVRTLALGLSFWSLMTTLSGTARHFTDLGLARIGVGIGEASSSPAAISLLGDYFERSRRGTVLALYSTGVYLGAGASLMIGGSIVSAWQNAYGPNALAAPFGLSGWQASFIGVGLPGLFFALLVLLTIREPLRGRLDQEPAKPAPHPFRNAMRDLAAMFPPWSWMRLKANHAAPIEYLRNGRNLALAIVLIIGATWATDAVLSTTRNAELGSIGGFSISSNLVQWLAMGIAFYACANWFQSARLSDPVTHRLISGSTTFRVLMVAGAFLAFTMNAVNGFVFLYATRTLGFTSEAGLHLGIIAVIAGGLGIALSGWLCDKAKRRHSAGRLYFVCFTVTSFTAASIVQFTTHSVSVFYVAYAVATFFVPMWFGPIQATTQDMVLPRLRGTAFATLSLGPNIFGLGMGPYCVGLISDATGDLRFAILCSLAALPIILFALFYAARTLTQAEALAQEQLIRESQTRQSPADATFPKELEAPGSVG